MKKNLFLASVFLLGIVLNAQVGINTNEPKATLDINAKKSLTNLATNVDGLLIPRITSATAQSKGEKVPESTLIYITDGKKGAARTTTSEVDGKGFYYFDATKKKWVKLGAGTSAYLVSEYVGSTGTWVQNISTDGNTVRFRVVNYSNTNLSALDFQNALTLNGASQGLSYQAAEDYSNLALAPREEKTLTYNISGTPLTYGTLRADFSALLGSVTSYGTVQIQEQSQVKALSLTFEGNYISNKTLDNTNKVILKIHNFSNKALSNVDLSQAVSVSGIDGVQVRPNQNTRVNLPVGREIKLTYLLEGAAVKQGDLLAVFEPVEQVAGNVNATQNVPLFSNASVSNMQITGDYVVQQAMDAKNKVQVTLTNNNPFELVHLNAKDALSLSGNYQDISVAKDQNTDFAIPARGKKVITYTLTGEPINGGNMRATWQQTPFGSTSANKTIAQFNVSPTTIYFEANDNGTGTITVRSSEAWNYEVQGVDWIRVTRATGQSGNGTLNFTTTPHTTAKAQMGTIRIYRKDGNGAKVTIWQPPTDNLETNIPPVSHWGGAPAGTSEEKFSINGETKDYTVTYNGNWDIQSYPDWVKSARKINNNTVRVIAKPRTEAGRYTTGNIVFSYGAGYLKTVEIAQKQKAEICPATPPAGFRADKGYLVWRYSSYPIFDELSTEYEERPGNDNFEDVEIFSRSGVSKKVVKSTTKSTLFLGPERPSDFSTGGNNEYSGYYELAYWSAYVKRDGRISSASYPLTIYGNPIGFESYKEYQHADRPRATQVFCINGFDENTPRKP